MRRWLAAHPRAIDIFVLVCYLIGAVPLAIFAVYDGFVSQGAPTHLLPGFVNAIIVALRLSAGVVALLFRSKAPFAGYIIAVAALFGESGPLIVANAVASWFLLYAVPVYRDVRTGWIAYGIGVAASLLSGLTSRFLHLGTPTFDEYMPTPGNALIDAIWLLVILLIGINLGNRRRYLAAIIDRANQLARERDQLAQLAVAEERSRIAREIHDIVAHSVSVMIALSEGGARAVKTAPDAAINAMERSAEAGRTALTEMRRLLGALHSDEAAELAPQPSVSELPELIRGFEDAGIAVTFESTGDPVDDRLQGLAMYRVVQEGLTNVLRYAGKGAHARVRIVNGDDGIFVSVRDYGRAFGTTGPTTGLGSGRGLAGLTERLRVFGGTIESGRTLAGDGWELTANFPHQGRQALSKGQTP